MYMVREINVREGGRTKVLFNAVSFAWRVSVRRTLKGVFVFAVTVGICGAAIAPKVSVAPAILVNVQTMDRDISKRVGYSGKEFSLTSRQRYYGKQLPVEMLWTPGKSNPISYNYR